MMCIIINPAQTKNSLVETGGLQWKLSTYLLDKCACIC